VLELQPEVSASSQFPDVRVSAPAPRAFSQLLVVPTFATLLQAALTFSLRLDATWSVPSASSSLNPRAVAAVMPSQKMLTFSLSRPEALDSRVFSQLPDARSPALLVVSWVPSLYRLSPSRLAAPKAQARLLESQHAVAPGVPRPMQAFSPEPSRSSEQHPPKAAWHSTAESYPGYVSL
jgi:hypothetical protein